MTEAAQPRDDRGRWVAGGAGLGGAAGLALVARYGSRRVNERFVRPQQDALLDHIAERADAHAIHAHTQSLKASGARIEAAMAARLKNIRRGFKYQLGNEPKGSKPGPVTLYARMLRNRITDAEEQLDGVRDIRVDDPAGLVNLSSNAQSELEELRSARPALRGPVAPAQAARRAATISRKGRVYAVEQGKAWVHSGATRRLNRKPDIDRDYLGEIRTTLQAHAAKLEARAQFRAQQRANRVMNEATGAWYREEAPKIEAEGLRRIGRVALRQKGAIGVIGLAAGALLGAGAGYAATRKFRAADLKKAAPRDDEEVDVAGQLRAIGDHASGALADRLGTVFRGWKDEATSDLLHAPAGTLTQSIRRGLDYATKPLGDGFRGGVGAPVVAQGEGEAPRALAFTFTARQPDVERYIEQYRQNKITALAAEQQEAVKAELIDAARSGAPPDVIARRVRQIIGLTPGQAQAVRNYRAELEQASPVALKRALRDRRYDKKLQEAIAGGHALSPERIDKMVDAYHRRSLAARALTIGRTEGVSAANNGHILALRRILEANPDWTVAKTWMATDDERTRHDHRDLHGQTVFGLDTPFVCDSGDQILFPGDQSAPARQVIRCRCTLATRLVPRNAMAQRGFDTVPRLRPIRGKVDAE